MRAVVFVFALFVAAACAQQACSVQGTWKNDFNLAVLPGVGLTGYLNSTINFDGDNFKSSTIRGECKVSVDGTFTYTDATGDLTFIAGIPDYDGDGTSLDCQLLVQAAGALGAQPDSSITFASDCLSYNESLSTVLGVIYREWTASAATLALAPVLLVLLFAHLAAF